MSGNGSYGDEISATAPVQPGPGIQFLLHGPVIVRDISLPESLGGPELAICVCCWNAWMDDQKDEDCKGL